MSKRWSLDSKNPYAYLFWVASAGTLLLLVTRNQTGFESKHLWVVASIATLASAPFRT